jgi:tetratricopeptide (TPR) repeat protein
MRIVILPYLIAVAALFAVPVVAQTAPSNSCPTVPDTISERGALHAGLLEAPNTAVAQLLQAQLWEEWFKAPDVRAKDLLTRGLVERESFAWAEAEATFTQLIEYCPEYSEGWNQRAFIRYLRQDYANALPDLEIALSITPDHIGALSGKGLTLLRMGRAQLAQETIRIAVSLNPWLSERALLVDDLETDL